MIKLLVACRRFTKVAARNGCIFAVAAGLFGYVAGEALAQTLVLNPCPVGHPHPSATHFFPDDIFGIASSAVGSNCATLSESTATSTTLIVMPGGGTSPLAVPVAGRTASNQPTTAAKQHACSNAV